VAITGPLATKKMCIMGNRRNIKKILFPFLIISLCACSFNKYDKEGDQVKYFSGMNFPNPEEPNTGLGHVRDTLEITVSFNECGEWGGRIEKMIIYRDFLSKKLKAQLTKDTVSCERIISKNGYSGLDDDTRVIEIDVTKVLTLEDERLLNILIHRILELSLNDERFKWDVIEEDDVENIEINIFIDSGVHFEIKTSSMGLYLSYWNIDQGANTWYGKIRNKIFGELIIMH
jgi:hypothetical protein